MLQGLKHTGNPFGLGWTGIGGVSIVQHDPHISLELLDHKCTLHDLAGDAETVEFGKWLNLPGVEQAGVRLTLPELCGQNAQGNAVPCRRAEMGL
jgi:hypothetical protein